MQRFEDWPERLAALFERAADRPFRRGRHDCALFAGEAVFVMTGTDLRKPFLGKYKTRRGADGALKRFAGTMLDATVKLAAAHGAVEIEPGFAQRGDIAYVEMGDLSALAVLDLAGTFVTTGPGVIGFLPVPRDYVLRVWRFG